MGESVVNYLGGGIRPRVRVMFNADHGTGLAPCGGITDRRGGDRRHTADLFSDDPWGYELERVGSARYLSPVRGLE
jgi:hypothetical protein